MSRSTALGLYALLVIIWSSTWVAIKIGLEDAPAPLGIPFGALAFGAVLYDEAITGRAVEQVAA